MESNLAIVSNIPGTTRTRNIGEASWRGKQFRLIDTGGLTFSDFTPVLIGLSAVMVFQELAFRSGHFIENTMVVKAFDRITTFLFQTLIHRPTAYFEEKFSGELTRRVEQVGAGVRFFIVDLAWEVGWPSIGIVMSAILLGNSNIWLAVVFLIWLTIFLSLSIILLRIQYKYSQNTSEKHAALSGTLVDIFSNVSLVQAFAAQDHEFKHYRKYMDDTIVTEEKGLQNFLFNKFQQGMSIVTLTIALVVTSVLLYVRRRCKVLEKCVISLHERQTAVSFQWVCE
jgi:ATP-binding cassette subfamily B protein